MKRSRLLVLMSAVLVLSACVSSSGDERTADDVAYTYLAGFGASDSAASTTSPAPVTDEQTTATTATVVPVEPVARTEAPEPVEPVEPVDDGLNPFGGDSPEDRLMPSVVCMDLQEAQDEIQDHGVFLSRSEDATGVGRRQVWDRNWQVIAQTPEPGAPIGEREAVLFVVKDGDDHPNPC